MSPGRRRLRRALAVLGAGLGVVGIAAAGGVLWLSSAAGNRWIATKALEAADAALPGRLTVGSLDTNVIRFLELRDVTLTDADGRPLVHVERARLEVELRGLLARTVRIRSLELDRPDVSMAVLEGGQLDLLAAVGVAPTDPDAPDEPATPWGGIGAWTVEVERLILKEGRLAYRDAPDAEAAAVHLTGIGLDAAATVHQATVTVPRLMLQLDADAPVDTPARLELAGALVDGDVRLDELAMSLARTRLTATGAVRTVETAPDLSLELDVPRVDADEVNRLAGQELLAAHPALRATVRGPLDDLAVRARLSDPGSGALDLQATADVLATPLAWTVTLETPRFDLQPLLPAITEPVVIDGRWFVDGQGVGWPDDLDARFEVDARAPVVWGEPLSDLVVRGQVTGGMVTLTQVEAAHPVGRLRADGTVGVLDSSALLQVDARVPTLGALRRYGAPPLSGGASFQGTVRADWGADPVRVQASGQLRGSALRLVEQDVLVEALSAPLRADVVGGDVSASGALRLTGVRAPSAAVGELSLPSFRATWSARAGAAVEADLDARRLDLGDGAVRLESIVGTAGGGADARNVPFAQADVVMSDLILGSAEVRAEGGPVEMRLDGSALVAQFDLDRREDAFFEGAVTGDLSSGDWTIDGLVLAPLAGKPWHAPAPVVFQLADGGVRGLRLALDSSSGRLVAKGDWVGATADGTDLDLQVSDLLLADVAEIVQVYAPAEPGAAPLLEGLSGTLSLDALLSDWSGPTGAGLDLDLDIAELHYPGAVQQLDVALAIDGSFGRPALDLALSTPEEGRLLVAHGAVPLWLQGGLPGGLDCAGEAELDVTMTPGRLARLESAVPDLDLPDGDVSAALTAWGSPCDPQLDLTAAAVAAVGRRGEKVRLDLEVVRDGPTLEINGLVVEGLVRRLLVEGSAQTHLSERLAALLPAPPADDGPADAAARPTAPASGASTTADGPDLALASTWLESFDIRLSPMGLPIGTLGLFSDLPPGLRGTLGGGVQLSGTPKEPVLSGALLLVEGALGSVPLDQAQVLLYPGTALESGAPGYRVDARVGFGAGGDLGDLTLDGHLPLSLDLDRAADQVLDRPGLDLSLAGAGIPLEVLPGLVGGIPDASGRLALTGTVTGTLVAPVFDTRARLKDGSLSSEELGLDYGDIQVDVSLDADKLSINRFSLTSAPRYGALLQSGGNDKSRLSLAGTVLMKRLTPTDVQVHLSATDFWLISSDSYQLRANARMDAGGAYPSVAVTGSTELVQGRVALPDRIFLDGSALDLAPVLTIHRKRAKSDKRVAEPSPLLEHMRFDLDVDLHRGLRLMASIPTLSDYGQQFAELSTVEVDIEVASQGLKVQGSPTDVAVNGTLELSRGDMNIMGRVFDVSGGSVSFVSDVTDPVLDVHAIHRTGQYGDVSVDVGGSVNSLQLDFSSDDYPDKTDVMAILLLGKPTSEMSNNEGEMGGALLSAAVGSVTSNLSRTVSSAFLGNIEFDSDSFKVGFPVGRNVFGSLELRSTEDDDENGVEITLEWLLSRRLSAELVTGDAPQTSADLYYRWRF